MLTKQIKIVIQLKKKYLVTILISYDERRK